MAVEYSELSKEVKQLTEHSANCGEVAFFKGELPYVGLAVVLTASCTKRDQRSVLTRQSTSDPPLATRDGTSIWLLFWDKWALVGALPG